MYSGFASLVGVGSLLAVYCGRYGTLTERFADADPLVPTWTTRFGVLPLLSLPTAGELFRTIRIGGARLGVSAAARLPLADRLKRGISYCCCFGGEDGAASSAKSAWVTLENLIAGGGSSSESLSE